MQFLPGANPMISNLGLRTTALGKIDHLHAGDLGYEDLAPVHFLQGSELRSAHLVRERSKTESCVRPVMVILPVLR